VVKNHWRFSVADGRAIPCREVWHSPRTDRHPSKRELCAIATIVVEDLAGIAHSAVHFKM